MGHDKINSPSFSTLNVCMVLNERVHMHDIVLLSSNKYATRYAAVTAVRLSSYPGFGTSGNY